MKKIKEFYEKYKIKIGMIIVLSILLLMVLKFGADVEDEQAPDIGVESGITIERIYDIG